MFSLSTSNGRRIGYIVAVGYEPVDSSPTSSLFAYAWSRDVRQLGRRHVQVSLTVRC